MALLFFRLLLAAACLATVSLAEVVELGVDNLAATIKSVPWTILLFYDRNDDKANKELGQLINGLDDFFASNPDVGTAKLDIRRHIAYRDAYLPPGNDQPLVYQYYASFPEPDFDDWLGMGHKAFMNFNGDLYWPNRVVLMDDKFNVHGQVQLDFNAQVQAKIDISAQWVELLMNMVEDDSVEGISLSPINLEAQIALEREDDDNSFPFEGYVEEELEEEDNDFLLESGVTENADSMGPYSHEIMDDDDETDDWLHLLGVVIHRYLIWIEGYEVVWDSERKAREDEQTKFGPLLCEMNQQVRDLIDAVLPSRKKGSTNSSAVCTSGDGQCSKKDAQHIEHDEGERNRAVPNLRPYLEDMVFGFGRSPTRLGTYFKEEVVQRLGPDAATRRAARNAADSKDFPIFERMREYMKVVEEVKVDEELYSSVLAELVTKWHNILVDFHNKLNQNYLEYLAKNPLPDNSFKKRKIEVIDMKDPKNFDLLTTYDAYHERHTKQAIPVLLDNVNMTSHQCTLDYLIEQCGSIDVTSEVKVSNKVGQKSANDWGGLENYILDEDLLNDERIENGYDRDLTLEQFITLSRKLDTVYLHDMTLPDKCAKLLHEETLYDEHQKFRIPSVIASYDLFQRVPMYSYAQSWPSLFIGKKGSNSKLHVDSGATGFFMYLVSGRKRWIIAKPTERPFLYGSITKTSMVADVLGIDKSEEANEFLSKRFPLLHRAEDMYEVIQEPGQLVYIPPDSPHAVENLEDTVGISMNYVPRDAFPRHLHDEIHFSRAYGFAEIAMKYMLFEDNAEQAMPTKDPLYMTFAEYKGQW